jgi:hypothetical protein
MQLTLKLHPDSRCDAVSGITVHVVRTRPAHLALRYVVTGRIGDLRVPPASTLAPGQRLWEHTCFEVFVATMPLAAYSEFNFAPSRQWAAYQFSSYRKGRTVTSEARAPAIDVQTSAGRYELQASLPLDGLDGLPADAPWQLGISTVIEEANGSLSYWALAHPVGKADFHHSDCFALELSAA